MVIILAGPIYAGNPQTPKIELPEDLGPSAIDVSDYPEEHKRTYKEVFVPVFGFLGGTARAVNSPLIELDPNLEEAERKASPELFSDPAVAVASRDAWKVKVKEIHTRPPCCGACPVLSQADARALWRFLVYDSIRRKTGAQAKAWAGHRKALLERFRKEHPDLLNQNQTHAAYAATEVER